MNVIIFGATGMLGQGVLRECLFDGGVTRIVIVGRVASGRTDSKLREIVLPDMFEFEALQDELGGFDACFFCLGIASLGLTEPDYQRITYDLTLAIATRLVRENADMVFAYVSGAGTGLDRRAMWARVKGRTEAALGRLPFKAVYLFRPGYVQPMNGAVSKTALYRMIYAVSAPIAWVVGSLSPAAVTTTERVGRAMITVARHGYSARILDNGAINDAAQPR